MAHSFACTTTILRKDNHCRSTASDMQVKISPYIHDGDGDLNLHQEVGSIGHVPKLIGVMEEGVGINLPERWEGFGKSIVNGGDYVVALLEGEVGVEGRAWEGNERNWRSEWKRRKWGFAWRRIERLERRLDGAGPIGF